MLSWAGGGGGGALFLREPEGVVGSIREGLRTHLAPPSLKNPIKTLNPVV